MITYSVKQRFLKTCGGKLKGNVTASFRYISNSEKGIS